MPWIMEIKIGDKWIPISMEKKPPYIYDTEKEAFNMLFICYPEQVRRDRLSGIDGEKCTRIREVTNATESVLPERPGAQIVYGNGSRGRTVESG